MGPRTLVRGNDRLQHFIRAAGPESKFRTVEHVIVFLEDRFRKDKAQLVGLDQMEDLENGALPSGRIGEQR